MAPKQAQAPSWSEMIEYAVSPTELCALVARLPPHHLALTHPRLPRNSIAAHSNNGGEKISRVKIKAYIENRWSVDANADRNKDAFKEAINKKVEQGLLAQIAQSFEYTNKGDKHWQDNYGDEDEEEEEEEAPKKKK
ncbi:hypothetical protein JCM8097_002363 [Rhodosporidiobolus ruineniae]